ncbi:MAG: hypothetical protein QJR05_08620 [Thermoanaerobacterium sp.]|nr:hypothetical protein [Thermoanaerobacterium sp.]
MKHLISIELKKALNLRFFLFSLALILLPLITILPIINGSYVFHRTIDVHEQLLSSSPIPLLFPLLLIPLYAGSYANEKKDNYLQYVMPRTKISDYVVAKGISNALITFIVAYLMIYIPFLFIQYIDPMINYIYYETAFMNPVSIGTFEVIAQESVHLYGVVYSLWVAINGVLYVTIAYLLSICLNNTFVALSIPFLWWFIIHFVTSVLGLEKFSPLYTVFPFAIAAQQFWTIFIPFIVLILFIVSLIFYIKRSRKIWEN